MFGESMLDTINESIPETDPSFDLNDLLDEASEAALNEMDFTGAFESTDDDLSDLDEDFDPSAEEDEDDDYNPETDDEDLDEDFDPSLEGTGDFFNFDDSTPETNQELASEQIDVIEPVNTSLHNEVDLEDTEWDSFFNFDGLALEAVHPISAAITGLTEVNSLLNAIPVSVMNLFSSVSVAASLFLMAVFDKLAFQNRINDLKKKAKNAKDPVDKKKLEDKAARADYIRKFANGFVQKQSIDEKLNKPNILDKAMNFFNEINYGISETFIDHLEKQSKKQSEKGNDYSAAVYKNTAALAKSRVLESALDEMFNFDF